jgi:hypothetical protein
MELDPADVRPSILNWVVVGLMAITFIAVFKFILAKWPIPGLSPLVTSI